MRVYPAVDILNGTSVRLRQGRPEDATIYGDPLEMARRWHRAGADWVHVVDLDGAFRGEPQNAHLIRSIHEALPELKMQVGGGIRSMSAVEMLLEAGAARVVIGTAAVLDQEFAASALERYGGQIAAGIDARDGRVRISGWTEESAMATMDLARKLEAMGTRLAVYTDISRDGELVGPNTEATAELVRSTRLRIIASGGVSSLEDLRKLRDIDHPRLEGVIVGKALYEGRFRLDEAFENAR